MALPKKLDTNPPLEYKPGEKIVLKIPRGKSSITAPDKTVRQKSQKGATCFMHLMCYVRD